ncbi:hypothetical protein C8Q72DRAFT_920160 [Fomitopsis betulina]|nr:hypothetical protein C8Q72DRAFT_920160 [Fomitopsis betulina]
MAWQPYNISFDDKSPLFYYEPYRGEYETITVPTWAVYNEYNGTLSSYTTSIGGASVTLQLPAMVSAFWVYGECDASAVTIDRSWNGDAILNNATPAGGGVLYSEDGLTQDLNSVTLTVNGGRGPVTITGATVTIKMGTWGSTIKTTNISSLIESIPAIDPFFTTNDNGSSWGAEVAIGSGGGLEEVLATNTSGDFVTFEVNSSVAFAIYGETDTYQGTFLVDINPPLPHNASATYNASSPWVMIEQIKYLATGLNETTSYTVNISNAESGKQFNIGEVVLFSAIPPSSNATSTRASDAHHHDVLSGGVIAGITIGSVAATAMILAFAVVLFRKGKLRVGVTAIDIEPATPVEPNATQLSNNVQEVFSRRPISSMISRPFVKSYADPVDIVADEVAPQAVYEAESSYRKLGDVVSDSDANAVAGPSILPTHAEDAGPVPEVLPPVYNPEWNNSSPGVV